MNNVVQKPFGQIACQADFGNERTFDMEYPGENELWLAVGAGIEITDLWVKSVKPDLDLRIRARRTEQGIEVVIDRGRQNAEWWPEEESPRLVVAINKDAGTVSASARIGRDAEMRETVLGTVSIDRR